MQAVAQLKAEDGGEIQVHGSGNLVARLSSGTTRRHHPYLAIPRRPRQGQAPFRHGAIPRGFRLVDLQRTTPGAVLLVYELAGPLKYGEVEVGQETVIFD